MATLPNDPGDVQDRAELELISTLTTSEDTNTASIGSELEALEAIYPGALLLSPSPPSSAHRLRYEIALPAWEDGGASADDDGAAPRIRVLVTLPDGYPDTAPRLQIMGRYVGAYAIDPGLFGDITRTFISSSGVGFTPGVPAVFDGLVHVQSLVEPWYRDRAAAAAVAEAAHDHASRRHTPELAIDRLDLDATSKSTSTSSSNSKKLPRTDTDKTGTDKDKDKDKPARPLPHITSSSPITDRKSQFVGHACRVADEEDVLVVVSHLLQDRRIARAAHPTIWAYRTVREVGGPAGRVVESDYDDDGETQAGSRLQHLLQVLDLTGVLVVVTRWFGGIHLGPDRFKHINQAARDALEAGGFLEEVVKKGRRK
ncbi:hypothetical protein CspeluHIS016_0302860 [Cutaneotrichosporon spelunceum]|uniref:RWD domain-containing protein n=1 Tax=Cutaneotrichosporon spelunceum TaxID=1672016 RepID=A0AAD3TTY1_9TREE|nr:hypothetical protein CspeluHIS016_0302860 [Cutaneotrichosporon spelunceum]